MRYTHDAPTICSFESFNSFLNPSYTLCRTSKIAVEEQKRIEMQLAQEVETARTRITEIQQELESVVEQLGEAKVDKHESARAIKKSELIDNLKRLFPGVHGRLIDLCEPSHKKYQVRIFFYQ